MTDLLQIRSFSSQKIEVFDPVFIDAIVASPLEPSPFYTYAFGGLCMAYVAEFDVYVWTEADTPGLANAKAILAQNTILPPGEVAAPARLIVGGEIAANLVLFAGQPDQGLSTIPPGGSDSFETQLREYGINVVYPQTIIDNDFTPCGPWPPPG